MRELNLTRIEHAVNKWFKEHNFEFSLEAKRLEKVYQFKVYEDDHVFFTKLTERKTFDASWEDHIEEMVYSVTHWSLDKEIEARNRTQ